MLKITTTKKKIFSVRYIKLKSTNHLLNLFQESASTTVPTIRFQKRLESKSPMAPTLQVKQFAIGLKGLDLKRVLEKFIHVNHSLHKLLTPLCRYTRPGNRATLGLLRTYFYYCRIVGLVPVIPLPPKNNWQQSYYILHL